MTEKSVLPIPARDITGVILAGGRGRRLGGVDKGLVEWHGRPLIEYVIDVLRPQVGHLLISANRNYEHYAAYGFPVVADIFGDYEGPLAGMLSTLCEVTTPFILTAPCDTPLLPTNLAERLGNSLTEGRVEVSVVSCQGQMQAVIAMMRRTLADNIQEYLSSGGREVREWMRCQNAALADYSDRVEAFTNINTPEDIDSSQPPSPGKN